MRHPLWTMLKAETPNTRLLSMSYQLIINDVKYSYLFHQKIWFRRTLSEMGLIREIPESSNQDDTILTPWCFTLSKTFDGLFLALLFVRWRLRSCMWFRSLILLFRLCRNAWNASTRFAVNMFQYAYFTDCLREALSYPHFSHRHCPRGCKPLNAWWEELFTWRTE